MARAQEMFIILLKFGADPQKHTASKVGCAAALMFLRVPYTCNHLFAPASRARALSRSLFHAHTGRRRKLCIGRDALDDVQGAACLCTHEHAGMFGCRSSGLVRSCVNRDQTALVLP